MIDTKNTCYMYILRILVLKGKTLPDCFKKNRYSNFKKERLLHIVHVQLNINLYRVGLEMIKLIANISKMQIVYLLKKIFYIQGINLINLKEVKIFINLVINI